MRDVLKSGGTTPSPSAASTQSNAASAHTATGVATPKRPKKRRPSVVSWVKTHKVISSIIAVLLVAGIIAGVLVYSARQNDKKAPASEVVAEYQKRLPDLASEVKNKPNDASARKNYAVALYATGDLHKARQQYEKAVDINDKDSTAYNNLGNVYRDLKNNDKAVEAYKKSIELNSKSINTYVNLANVQLYVLDKADDAIATYKSGLKALPNNEQLELLLGLAYEHSGDTAKAKQTYQNILSRNGENVAAKANLERLN